MAADAFKKIFESGLEDYDAVIETNEDGRSVVSLKDYAMNSGDIQTIRFSSRRDDDFWINKYTTQADGSIARVSQAIADALSVGEGDYFRTDRTIRVAIGIDSDAASREQAIKMSTILAASNIAVTLVDEHTDPFMLADLTRKGQGPESKYDLAFHISQKYGSLELMPMKTVSWPINYSRLFWVTNQNLQRIGSIRMLT